LLFPYGYTCIPTHDHTYCTIYQLSILHIYYEGLDTALPYVAGFVPVGDGPGMLNEEEVVSKYDKQKTMPSTMHGLVAAELALNDAGYTKDVLDKLTDSERERMVCKITSSFYSISNTQ
jgi:hypothetical protein